MSLASCVGTSLLQSCCCALRASRGASRISVRAGKAGYLILLTIASIAGFVLYAYGDKATFLQDIGTFSSACSSAGALTSQCYGASAVLRISLACAVFFAICALFALSEDSFVGCWAIKALLWAGLIAASFFFPADTVVQYGATARAFSIVFLLALVILLIDFAYHAQEWLGEKMDEEEAHLGEKYEVGLLQNKWRVLYLFIAFVCTAASLGGIIALYYWSANRPDGVNCSQNIGFISTTLVLGLTLLVASPLEACGGRGIVTPSLVWAYTTWLAWSGIDAQPYAPCNPTPVDASNTGATIVGIIIAAGSLVWTAHSASRSLPLLFHSTLTSKKVNLAAERAAREAEEEAHQREHDEYEASHPSTAGLGASLSKGMPKEDGASTSLLTGPKIPARDVEATGSAAAYDAEPHHHHSSSSSGAAANGEQAPYTYSVMDGMLYCTVLSLASLYFGQVATQWVDDPANIGAARTSASTMWVQIGTQWATFALYGWTLLAPKLFPNRDFD